MAKKTKKEKDQNLSYGVIVGRSKLMRWLVNLICEGERERKKKREIMREFMDDAEEMTSGRVKLVYLYKSIWKMFV